jgi:hypothetical protein
MNCKVGITAATAGGKQFFFFLTGLFSSSAVCRNSYSGPGLLFNFHIL